MTESLNITHTLCLPLKEDQALLAMKKRGFGEGKWNGAGGKIEESESSEEGATRETREEFGIIPKSLTLVAVLVFKFIDKPEWDRIVDVYLTYDWNGEPSESEEMRPKWFKKSEIPLTEMWEADTHWLPLVLEGKTILGNFDYTADQKLQTFNLREADYQELSTSFNRSMLSKS
ncbi:hypothetical protein A3A14_04280 [Candidatus Daviesbacteria bacterium RIFCSPLOWO2_01_FULL_43_38]|uniref:Oxidized purine nucleoside triphosphate hydrolase n=2 Tax=Candidatus Daviesiibacteriota TaxID=1752718 RepID=A0A1F5K049_9BACT|nr:MAG: hypothetical protein UV41_C0043G0006 [Candidatus Daviesbacteria bacterium GW2011_GWA2_42_7]OGE34246.1 MAG: hypothetical protein A3E45_04625 [Candidatus Daviesbacteria bacterium RIFCSPHIGHO2_12_FULL_43_11]OGE63754.1 MAG: hypothetical protein A3A14_04280 [Candidatus Daviesbacteria bacterium RIFCSPLOWO2_01_FULL_43_38]OGE69264.1 MAG: hypothetical protein A3J21_01395 [Candidatus Daviesbacteria bacterium RIFCSPLOWO2_02_FULL_43_11]